MKKCKICGSVANTDRLLCKECYRRGRSGHLGKEIPEGVDFYWHSKRYVVTKAGEVFSTITFKFLSKIRMNNGYLAYSFGSCSAGTRKQILANRLVAYCYGLIESLDTSLCIDHLDGNKWNNNLSNLEPVAYSENEIRKNIRTKGALYAHKDITYGPYRSVKEAFKCLNIQGSLGSFYTQVSRGAGYGYTFTRENI